jgi:hypothetical protein
MSEELLSVLSFLNVLLPQCEVKVNVTFSLEQAMKAQKGE